MKLAINKNFIDKPTPEILSTKEYRTSFKNFDIDIKRFVEMIQSGYAFCSALTRPYRARKYFESGCILAADYDTEDERSSFEFLSQDPFISRYASFMYTTPSHKPDAPRARVVFELTSPIYQRKMFEVLSAALLGKLGHADPACKDAARIFFGSKDCDVLYLENRLPTKRFIHQVETPFARKLSERQVNVQRNIVYNGAGTYVLKQRMNTLLESVANSVPGERNNVLNSAAFVLGGIAAAGYKLSLDEAAMALHEQSASLVDPLPSNEIELTIKRGLTSGYKSPIYLDDPHSNFIKAFSR